MSARKNNKWDTNSFVLKMYELHPNYDFTKTDFINSKTKVSYLCKIHGEKKSYPRHLLNGHICRSCNPVKPRKLTEAEILYRFKQIHGDTYDYSKVNFNVCSIEKEKTIFICKKHGEFIQSIHCHIIGRGCPLCADENRTKKASENPSGWSLSDWEKSAKKSKRFDSFKLYIIECFGNGEHFYKIGRTFYTVNKRFSGRMPYNYKLMYVYESDAKTVYKLEAVIKSENRKYKYTPKISFNGKEECYSDLVSLSERLNIERQNFQL